MINSIEFFKTSFWGEKIPEKKIQKIIQKNEQSKEDQQNLKRNALEQMQNQRLGLKHSPLKLEENPSRTASQRHRQLVSTKSSPNIKQGGRPAGMSAVSSDTRTVY